MISFVSRFVLILDDSLGKYKKVQSESCLACLNTENMALTSEPAERCFVCS